MSRANPRFRRINPALPAPASNVWEVVVQGAIEGQMTLNTFYYWDSNAALIATSESNVAAGWLANCFTPYKACLSSDWTGVQLLIRSMTSPTRNTFISTAGIVGQAGTGPAGHEPTMVAVVIDRYTQFRGQCGRGRVGIPAVPTGWVTASTLTNLTAHLAFTTNMGVTWVQAGATYVPYLWSRGSRANHTVGAAPIAQLQLRATLGTIRRRKIGRGR